MLLRPRFMSYIERRTLLYAYKRMPSDKRSVIDDRVNYCCRLVAGEKNLPDDAMPLDKFSYRNHEIYHFHTQCNSAYFFDTYEYTRLMPKGLMWAFNPGDINYLFPVPEITKSRLITKDDSNRNNVLLNLDKCRHFVFINDPFMWEDKMGKVLFRGACHGKPRRENFMRMFFDNPLFNIRDTAKDSSNPPEWQQQKEMTLYDHLSFRYIMALEGNDVASNLKWVMSSNSCAVMPRPTCETWFMEGKLIPGYHYIEIREDYSDLIDKIQYYEAHPEEAQAIVEHAHQWCAQFQDQQTEDIVALKVLEKYFRMTGQIN